MQVRGHGWKQGMGAPWGEPKEQGTELGPGGRDLTVLLKKTGFLKAFILFLLSSVVFFEQTHLTIQQVNEDQWGCM